jgi:hypothetical protein
MADMRADAGVAADRSANADTADMNARAHGLSRGGSGADQRQGKNGSNYGFHGGSCGLDGLNGFRPSEP